MTTVKQRTNQLFLKSAKKMFISKGISSTFMEDIAQDANKTRRTLYRYYSSKEELAYQVLINIMLEWNDYQLDQSKKLSGHGLDRLEKYLLSLVYYMDDRKDLMRFVSEFDHYFDDKTNYQIDLEIQNEVDGLIPVSEVIIKELLLLGKEDGSIVLVDEIDKIVATISSSLWSFGQMLAMRGVRIYKESGYIEKELIECQIALYIKSLKA